MKKQKEHANPDNQRTRKQKGNIPDFDFLHKKRDSYILLTEELNMVLLSPALPDHVLSVILDDKTLDKLSVGDILEKYEHFTKKQSAILKKYIHSHLHDNNPLFVSDLIDCANWNDIESVTIFDFCLDTIKNRYSSSLVLSAIMYVFEHMRISQSVLVVPVFEHVLNNKKYYQNCQIIAAFCLFRITMNPQYLHLIREYVSANKYLHEVLTNKMLLMDYCRDKKYFYYGKEVFENSKVVER